MPIMRRVDQASDDQERERRLAEYRDDYRELFDLYCRHAEWYLSALDRVYSREFAARRGKPGEWAPRARRFRDEATAFLADADRIKGLQGKQFFDAATMAFDAFTSMDDMESLKAEIRAQWAAAPFSRRMSIRLRDRLRKARSDDSDDFADALAKLEAGIDAKLGSVNGDQRQPDSGA